MRKIDWAKQQKIKFGIQGGVGSFNEEALNFFTTEKKISNFETVYLYTTENVFEALKKRSINFGLFAIHNSVGGIVDESLEAISKYTFEVCDEVDIPIQHFLMKRKDIETKDISKIMAHPQVLSQCKNTLNNHYSYLSIESGEGNMIDTAECARALSEGMLLNTIAILGPRQLSSLYNLDIIADNLQDDRNNITSFLLVKNR